MYFSTFQFIEISVDITCTAVVYFVHVHVSESVNMYMYMYMLYKVLYLYNVLLFKAIQAIADSWKDLELDIAPYKERGHFRLK